MRLILLVQLIVILFLVECQAARAPRPPPPPPPYRCSKRDRNCVEWTQQSPPPTRIKFKKMSLSARNPIEYTKTTPSPTTTAPPPPPPPSTKPPSLDLSALTVQQLIDLLNQKSAKESVTPPKLDRQIEPIQRPRIPNSLLPPPPHYDHRLKKPSPNNNEININQKIRSDIQVDSRDWNWDPEIYEPMHKPKGRKSQKSRSFERVRADDFDDFDDSDDDGSNFFNDRESQRESRPQRVFQPPRPVASPPRVAQSGDFPAWPIPVDLIQMNYPPQIERGIFGGYNADICNQAAQKPESSGNTKEQISKDSLFRPSLSSFFSDTIGKLGEESSKESSSNAKTSEKSDSGSIKSSDNQKSQLLNAFQKETSQGQVTSSSSSSSSSESTSETSAAVQAAAEKLAELKEAFERAKQ